VLEELNSLLKKVFSNEETLVFALLLTGSFLILFFLGNILTPFLISLIFAYLLIGMQSRMEQYGMNTLASLIFTYCFFLLVGVAMIVWLGPMVYQQLQSLILEIPKWVNSFYDICSGNVPQNYPDLVSSDQITTFLQSLSGQITSISQDFLKASIAGIQNTVTVAINLILTSNSCIFFFI